MGGRRLVRHGGGTPPLQAGRIEVAGGRRFDIVSTEVAAATWRQEPGELLCG